MNMTPRDVFEGLVLAALVVVAVLVGYALTAYLAALQGYPVTFGWS